MQLIVDGVVRLNSIEKASWLRFYKKQVGLKRLANIRVGKLYFSLGQRLSRVCV